MRFRFKDLHATPWFLAVRWCAGEWGKIPSRTPGILR